MGRAAEAEGVRRTAQRVRGRRQPDVQAVRAPAGLDCDTVDHLSFRVEKRELVSSLRKRESPARVHDFHTRPERGRRADRAREEELWEHLFAH